MSSDQAPLWPEAPSVAKAKRAAPGPVYQGVSKSIRYLEQLHAAEDDSTWPTRWAGTIAQARSLAASIDRDSGREPDRKQASGVSLATLHQQLDALLLRLDPQGVAAEGTSSWDELNGELAALEIAQRRRVMDGQE